MSMNALAKAASVCYPSVQYYETGKRETLHINNLRAIETALIAAEQARAVENTSKGESAPAPAGTAQ